MNFSPRQTLCHLDEAPFVTSTKERLTSTLKNFSKFRQLVLKSTNLWHIFTKEHMHPLFSALYFFNSFGLSIVFGVV